jgi:hypothetical protein
MNLPSARETSPSSGDADPGLLLAAEEGTPFALTEPHIGGISTPPFE